MLGPLNPVMPSFINIGQRLEGVGEQEELKAFTTAGFFGSEFGPMNLPFPEEAMQSVRPPKDMEAGRFANRYQLFRKLIDQSPERKYLGDFQRESQLRAMENAHRLLSPKSVRRSTSRWSLKKVTKNTTRDDLAAAACWRGGSSRKGPGSSRSPPNMCHSSIGIRMPMGTRHCSA